MASYGGGVVRLDGDFAARVGSQTNFALSMWVTFDSFTGDPAFFSNKNWSSGANTGINLALQTSGGPALDVNTMASGRMRRDIEPYGGMAAGRWHHVLLNVERYGETLLYVNGALYGEITLTSAGSFDGAFDFTFFNDGTGHYAGGTVSGLKIDEFAAWDRLLTADEIAYVARAPVPVVPEPSLVAVAGGVVAVGLARLSRSRRTKQARLAHARMPSPSCSRQ